MFNKYGVEKYDAFDDVGGKLSFALALLDKENTGLILNAVHSRDNCFLYMKEIVKGELRYAQPGRSRGTPCKGVNLDWIILKNKVF